jgi:hypothetical protein
MKAKVTRAINLNNRSEDWWNVMVSQGKCKKFFPLSIDKKIFFTKDKDQAKKIASDFNSNYASFKDHLPKLIDDNSL